MSICYDSTEVELCGHPSIHIQKLLILNYFLKHHSLTLLSHLASLFIKEEVFLITFLAIEALCIQSLLIISLNTTII